MRPNPHQPLAFPPPVSFNRLISTGGKSDAFASYQKKSKEQDKYAAVYIYPPDECAIIYIYGAKNILAPCGIKPLPGVAIYSSSVPVKFVSA